MKAAVYLGKESVEVREIAKPECGDNDVVIRNIYSSICGTDVAVFSHGPGTGHKITVGGEFGHETVSEVVEVGKNVTDFKVGERVYPYPYLVTGDRSRAGMIGGFSEYILAKNAVREKTLYPVPEEISDKTASLIEPFTVGCRSARRSNPQPGEKAVVFGCGTIGIAAAITLKWFGLEKVMICDISDYRLNIAKELDFEVCNTSTEDFDTVTREYFGTAPSLYGPTSDIDIMIDAAGAESILDLYMQKGKIESRFVCVAVNNALRNIDLLHMTFSQKAIIGSGGYSDQDVRDVMAMMASGKWDIERIITNEYPLEELDAAIRKASDSQNAFNVVINMRA